MINFFDFFDLLFKAGLMARVLEGTPESTSWKYWLPLGLEEMRRQTREGRHLVSESARLQCLPAPGQQMWLLWTASECTGLQFFQAACGLLFVSSSGVL